MMGINRPENSNKICCASRWENEKKQRHQKRDKMNPNMSHDPR